MTATVSDTLNQAADLIEKHGWTTGKGWPGASNYDGPLCLEGAVLAALGVSYLDTAFDKHRCPAYQAVVQHLEDREINPRSLPPFLWNDYLLHGRVMAAIDRGDTLATSLSEVRAEAGAWAKGRVIEVLRACAVIEAARGESSLPVPLVEVAEVTC